MTKKLHNIEIGEGVLYTQVPYLMSFASSFALIADDTTAALYAKPLLDSLGERAHLFIFPQGEQSKTRAIKERLEDQLLEKGLGRDCCVIALGGGIVTDMAGYIAATYCRGVPLVMMPTSLLAMVDASIGGKNGVNTPLGKNLIGTIYQPKKVVIDTLTLKSLPDSERKNGIAEMIKHAIIADSAHFEELEKRQAPLEKLISDSCQIKTGIVSEDEKEQGKRALLNFGHTIAHALEKLSNFQLPHGEAVAIGLIVESYISLQLGALDELSFKRIRNILESYELALQLPAIFSVESLRLAMALDKKALKAEPRFVVIERIGRAKAFAGAYCTAVDRALLKQTLEWMNNALYRD